VYDELKAYSEAPCVFDFEKKDCCTYANRKWQVEYPFVMRDNESGACQVCQIAHRCENRYNRAAGGCYFSGLCKQRLHAG